MKKFLAVVAAICLCISFISCSKEREKEMSTNPDVKQDIENKNKEAKKTEKETVPAVTVPENVEKDSSEKESSEKDKDSAEEKEETSKEEESQPIEVPTAEEFFPTVSREYVYEKDNSKTVIKMQDDGTFTGVQTVTDSSATGSNYSKGTKTECHFSGKFTMALPLDEYTYISVLEGYTVKNPSGGETIKDDTKYVYTESGGLTGMKEVVFYMPGAPTKAISDDFLNCMPGHEEFGDKLPDNLYGIFDMNSKIAFHSNK